LSRIIAATSLGVFLIELNVTLLSRMIGFQIPQISDASSIDAARIMPMS
jgi:hypothetical protein